MDFEFESNTKLTHILEKITSPGRNGQLTEAEIRILSFLMQGKSNSAIAQKLHVTTKTVEAHLTRIYRKLGVNSRSQAAVEAQKHHLYLDSKPVLLEEAY